MRAAVLEDGELVELHMEGGEPDRQTETLYYGRIQAVRPSVHAAFVEIGQELNAFLPLEDGVKLKIIGNADPIGVCGSGILAVVKELVRTGLVRKDGAFIKLKNMEETDYRYPMIEMV